jgi:O-antigen/teichoic acid export membrane protein
MKVRKIPRGTFVLGAAVGIGITLPLLALVLEAVARATHLGPADASRAHILSFAAIFAGFPTFISGGGVARLVAHRLAESASPRTLRGVVIAAVAMAIAGLGAALLTVVPLGNLPERPAAWWPLLAPGAGVGAVAGVAIGLVVSGRAGRAGRASGAGRALRHRERTAS